jgi:serine/threonine protein kinase
LADFGAAKPQVYAGVSEMSIGSQFTPAYSAPEVFQGECCALSDVWSLGLSVIELATGDHPWRRNNVTSNTEIICILAQRRCPVVPDLLASCVQDFISQCIRWEHAQRPTCLELLEHDMLNHTSMGAQPTPDASHAGVDASNGSFPVHSGRVLSADDRRDPETEIATTVDTYTEETRHTRVSRDSDGAADTDSSETGFTLQNGMSLRQVTEFMN